MRKKLPNLSYERIKHIAGLLLLGGVPLDQIAADNDCEPDHLRQVLLQRGVGVSVIAGFREVQADLGGFDAALEKLMARYIAPPSTTVVKIPAITLRGEQADRFLALKAAFKGDEVLDNSEFIKRLIDETASGDTYDLPAADAQDDIDPETFALMQHGPADTEAARAGEQGDA